VGPPVTPAHGDGSDRIDSLLSHLCAQAGVPYVSTLDISLPYLSDGMHPTLAGQETFGHIVAGRIAAALRAQGTPSTPPSKPSGTPTGTP
jgi:lysophospholipase L1-like esterase